MHDITRENNQVGDDDLTRETLEIETLENKENDNVAEDI